MTGKDGKPKEAMHIYLMQIITSWIYSTLFGVRWVLRDVDSNYLLLKLAFYCTAFKHKYTR